MTIAMLPWAALFETMAKRVGRSRSRPSTLKGARSPAEGRGGGM